MCYPATLLPLKGQYGVKKNFLQRKQSRNVRPMKVQFTGWWPPSRLSFEMLCNA